MRTSAQLQSSARRRPAIVHAVKLDRLRARVAHDALRLSEVHAAHQLHGVADAHRLSDGHSEGVEEYRVPKDGDGVSVDERISTPGRPAASTSVSSVVTFAMYWRKISSPRPSQPSTLVSAK